MGRRALLIINSKSRNGKSALETASHGLMRFGIEPVHRDCGSREQLTPLITKHGPEVDLIVIGGGDGTLNAAAEGVIATNRPLGILPTGTANDLARTLEIPTELNQAIEVVANGAIRAIDVGVVNDKLFFNVASIGLSAELAQRLTPDLKQRFGKMGYALAALRVLARARPFKAQIVESGGASRALTLQIAVGNGRFYGGGNVVERTATIDDGRLDLYSLEFARTWWLFLMLPSFRRGEHGAWAQVHTMQGGQFEIRTRRIRPVNADGELLTETPASFRVIPQAMKVIVPTKGT